MPNVKCTTCNTSNAAKCSVCKSIAYCSSFCQANNQKLHSMICNKLLNFIPANQRPHHNASLAKLLSPDAILPKLIWILGPNWLKLKIVTMGLAYNEPNLHKMLGDDDPVPACEKITKHHCPMFKLGHTVGLIYRATYRDDNSKSNPCNLAMLGTEVGEAWAGTVVIASICSSFMNNKTHQDVQGGDFHIAADYLKSVGERMGCDS